MRGAEFHGNTGRDGLTRIRSSHEHLFVNNMTLLSIVVNTSLRVIKVLGLGMDTYLHVLSLMPVRQYCIYSDSCSFDALHGKNNETIVNLCLYLHINLC